MSSFEIDIDVEADSPPPINMPMDYDLEDAPLDPLPAEGEYLPLREAPLSMVSTFASATYASSPGRVVGVGVVVGALLLASAVVASWDGGVVFFVVLVTLASAVFATWLGLWVLARPVGPQELQFVARAIREGSEGFFATQYAAIAKITAATALLVFLLYLFRPAPVSPPPPPLLAPPPPPSPSGVAPQAGGGGGRKPTPVALSNLVFALTASLSFLVGAICSGISGFVGMWMAVRANVRVAAAARSSYNDAIQVGLRGGAFSGLMVVVLVVAGLSSLFVINRILHPDLPVYQIPHLMTGFGFGASLVALFAQVGGGIYTKGADVGADLVGKVEQNIPEDDPRNPAVVADLVGDNVGDCAGRGADLFESISAEIIGSMIIGGTLAEELGLASPVPFMFFPLVVHTLDLVVSSVGVMVVKTSSSLSLAALNSDDPNADPTAGLEDPLAILKRGYAVSLALSLVSLTTMTYFLLDTPEYPQAWWHFTLCSYLGVCVSFAFLYITQYYTDYKYGPVRAIAEASTTGHGTNIIMGVAMGLESSAAPTAVICLGIIGSYTLGESALPGGGLFGTAVATMGLLSTAVYVLAMDTMGPIADNAGGIVEMSHQPAAVRAVTDSLDAMGNVTKAVTKGYGIGSAGLASFLLFRAFMDVIAEYSGEPFDVINFAEPAVFVGGLAGGGLVFLFSAWTMKAVGNTAAKVVVEVRRQFEDKPGIMDYSDTPDYALCVAIVARSALVEMIRPGLLAVLMPMAVGFSFRIGAAVVSNPTPLLGPQAVAGFLMVSTICGILMSLTLNNAGGAWDNAKKYIETGAFGGKNSEAHKASVTGDTVGDPFKDTSGPSLHVLIKLVATIALVMGPLFM